MILIPEFAAASAGLLSNKANGNVLIDPIIPTVNRKVIVFLIDGKVIAKNCFKFELPSIEADLYKSGLTDSIAVVKIRI
jgi:hypothetical protein